MKRRKDKMENQPLSDQQDKSDATSKCSVISAEVKRTRLQAFVNKVIIVAPLFCALALLVGLGWKLYLNYVAPGPRSYPPLNLTIPPCIDGYCPLDPRLVALNTSQGYLMLADGKPHSFFQLANHFVTQRSMVSCGVASAVMVLNSMHVEKPLTQCWPEMEKPDDDDCLRTFDEAYLTSGNTCSKDITRNLVTTPGLELHQVRDIFQCFNLTVGLYYGNETSEAKLREIFRKSFEPGYFVVVQYLRQGVFQNSGGHFSPIGAYNEANDRVLIMDVMRYLYPPVWVEAPDLITAVSSMTTANLSRGVLLVEGPSFPGQVKL